MVPSATLGDAAVPVTSAPNTDASWLTSPADASTDPSTSSALQSARNSARVCSTRVRCSASTLPAAHSVLADSSASSRGSGKWSIVRTSSTLAPSTSSISRTSRSIAIDLRSSDRELVDGDVLAPLEHVDADDVAVDRTDAGGDEPERAGTVGEPDPHEDVRGRLGGVAHGIDGTGLDDANVSPR